MTLPSKLSSLLASGSLILCGAEGETTQILQKYRAGLAFEAENAESLAETIRKARSLTPTERAQYIKNASTLYNTKFSKKVLLELYSHLILAKRFNPRKSIKGKVYY